MMAMAHIRAIREEVFLIGDEVGVDYARFGEIRELSDATHLLNAFVSFL